MHTLNHVTVSLPKLHADTKRFYEQHGFTCTLSGDDLVVSRGGWQVVFNINPNKSEANGLVSLTITDEQCHSTVCYLI